MKVFLNAEPEGHLFGRLEEMGFRGGRSKVSIKHLRAFAERVPARPISRHVYLVELQDFGVYSTRYANAFLEEVAVLGLEKNVLIEFVTAWPEPDLNEKWKHNPEELGLLCRKFWRALNSYGVELLCPAVHTMTRDALAYCEKMMQHVPQEMSFAIHRYTSATPSLSTPCDGNSSREEEMERVRYIANGRKIYITETGLEEGPYKRWRKFPLCFLKKKYWIDEEHVAAEVVSDLRFWARQGDIEGVVYYQLNDGPNRHDPEHTFGWRHCGERWDGPWKVVAQVMPAEIRKVDKELLA